MRACVKNTPKPVREAREIAWKRFCTAQPCRMMTRLIAANNFMRIAPREEGHVREVPIGGEQCLLSIVNGYWSQASSCLENVKGLSVIPFSEGYQYAGVLDLPDTEYDCFSLLAHAAYQEGLVLYVPQNTIVKTPLNIIQDITKPLWAVSRLHIVLGKNSSLQISEESSSSQQAILNTLVTVDVGEGSCLSFRHKAHSALTTCFSLRASIKKGSSFDFSQVVSSGSSRHSSVICLDEKARLSLEGLSLLRSHHESLVQTLVKHMGVASSSHQVWKGVVADDGHATHNMTAVLGAHGTESRQQSAFLTLGSRAHVRHEPRFEILHDTVQAAHGATTAMFDEEALFYLKSRGVPYREAKSLCIEGFCRDFLSHMSAQEIAILRNMV